MIGSPAAFLAALFLAVVHDLEHWLWDSLPSALGHSAPPWYLVLLLPPAGACVVLLARTLLPGDGGHPPLEGIGGGARGRGRRRSPRADRRLARRQLAGCPLLGPGGRAVARCRRLDEDRAHRPGCQGGRLRDLSRLRLPRGPVFPAIFLGIALAELTHVWFDVSPTLAVAVGAAAGMAAGTRLLITSTLFAPARRHRRAGCRSRRRARRLRRLDNGASA